MPQYTPKHLVKMTESELYVRLIEQQALEENLTNLNTLTSKEKIDLITKMVLACPFEQLTDLARQTASIRPLDKSDSDFLRLLSGALIVRSTIHTMASIDCIEPHRFMLNSEFNVDMFNRFHVLKCQLLTPTIAHRIAINLAQHIPAASSSKLMQLARSAFFGTQLLDELQQAMTLSRLLTSLLEAPKNFFESRDYNFALLEKFPELVSSHLREHEREVAEKIAFLEKPLQLKYMEELQLLRKIHESFALITLVYDVRVNPNKPGTPFIEIEEIDQAVAVTKHPSTLYYHSPTDKVDSSNNLQTSSLNGSW